MHHISKKEATREVALADLLRKFMLLKFALETSAGGKSSGMIEANEDFNQILAEVGNYLTSDELAAVGYIKYLNMSNGSVVSVAALKDRMFRAHESAMTYSRV